jgi:hypothetical protein
MELSNTTTFGERLLELSFGLPIKLEQYKDEIYAKMQL